MKKRDYIKTAQENTNQRIWDFIVIRYQSIARKNVFWGILWYYCRLRCIRLARHTFATTVTLGKGVPIETVSKMLGYTDIRTTKIYARIVDSMVSRDMEELSHKLGDFEDVYSQMQAS